MCRAFAAAACRPMRRWGFILLALGLAATAVACGDDEPSDEVLSVAFLRAVAGAPSTEPAFVDELRRTGFVEGRNLQLIDADPDVAYPDPEDARQVVEQWVGEGVDLIVALSTSGALAASEATDDVPILFLSNDPTAAGLVVNEDLPERNLTGVTFRVPADRTLDLARRVIPGLGVVGLAYPPEDPAAEANRDVLQAAALELGIVLRTETIDGEEDLGAAVASLADQGAQALVISTSPAATRILEQTGEVAAAEGLPVIANTTLAEFAVVSLAPDTAELGRQLGRQAARLLAGSSPGAVPVEDPRLFELTLNAAVADGFGLELPADVVRESVRVLR